MFSLTTAVVLLVQVTIVSCDCQYSKTPDDLLYLLGYREDVFTGFEINIKPKEDYVVTFSVRPESIDNVRRRVHFLLDLPGVTLHLDHFIFADTGDNTSFKWEYSGKRETYRTDVGIVILPYDEEMIILHDVLFCVFSKSSQAY